MPSRRVLYGVGVVCGANLLLEIAMTRLFSALMYYHFTFFAVALALLGLGASGVYVYANPDRFRSDRVERDLAQASRRFAAATLVTLTYVLANPVIVYVEFGEPPQFTNVTFLQLLLLCGVAAVPFFFSGLVASIAITHFRAAVERVYFFDLVGAGSAAVLVGLLIAALGGPGLVAAVAFLACAAAVLFTPDRRSGLALAASGLVLLLALGTGILDPPGTKLVKSERVVFDEWNTFSHITVEEMGEGSYDIRIDAAARTAVTHARQASSPDWERDITAFAYHFHPGGAESALIIGPGGGVDVAHALAAGVDRVVGVEINRLIATDVMRGRFEQASGGLYRHPRLTLHVDEGRSFIRRSRERYDVVQATLVDTWAATASGAFALSENTLYTVEAFDDYLDHLSDGGVLTMSRWWTFASGPETIRLVLLAAGALERRGLRPLEHLYLARQGNLTTLIVKKTPFATAEIARLDAIRERLGYRVLVSPTRLEPGNLAVLLQAGAWSDVVKSFPMNVSPPTDDRPFFFYFVRPSDLLRLEHFTGGNLANPAAWLLGALGAMLIALAILFVFVPLLARGLSELGAGAGGEDGALRRRLLGLAYFAAIGFAFMVVEIALMQRLSLFLGHPSFSLVLVLFGILIGTALGARASGRLSDRPGGGVAVGGLTVSALAVAAALGLADLLRALIGLPLPARMLLAVGIVLVFGMAMGLMLPLGVRLLSWRDPVVIPWVWGVNGGMSVIGTVVATVIAIHLGFTATFLVGAAFYAAAGGLGWSLARAATVPLAARTAA